MPTVSIQANIAQIQSQFPAGREICLVAVSKYTTPQQMIEAYHCGIRDFGENKIQDVIRKKSELPAEIEPKIRWHFLGHLQKNKAVKAIELGFYCIHSVDSLALAQKLSTLALAHGIKQRVLLQVNLTREPQKSGFLEADLAHVFPQLIMLEGLQINGLMTIGPNPPTPEASPAVFCKLKSLRDNLSHESGIALPDLSMGMSQDFHHALKCGATIIRVGNRLFNP